LAGLDIGDLDPDPIVQFERWFKDAVAAGLPEPSAMALATVAPQGRPSVRMVLLKGVDQRGFVFYTNFESRKAGELAANPFAALAFWWPPPVHRQVRIEGRVERVTREESEAYFRTRPLGSRLGAWASPQSSVIPGREELERRYEELAARYGADTEDAEVPLPPFWGGYRLTPAVIEFWQGRENRLHDRLRYTRERPTDPWTIERLAP
jgi:pyridoxamine 5'-phosphate oxidase